MHKFNMKQQKGVMRKKEGKRYEVREAVKDCIGLCVVDKIHCYEDNMHIQVMDSFKKPKLKTSTLTNVRIKR